jgi:hypothetical protein
MSIYDKTYDSLIDQNYNKLPPKKNFIDFNNSKLNISDEIDKLNKIIEDAKTHADRHGNIAAASAPEYDDTPKQPLKPPTAQQKTTRLRAVVNTPETLKTPEKAKISTEKTDKAPEKAEKAEITDEVGKPFISIADIKKLVNNNNSQFLRML